MTSDTARIPPTATPDQPTGRANVEDVLPLLPNQAALLLLGERAEVDPGFLQVRYRLQGPLDLGRYRHAWQEAVNRHPALRASIRARQEGDPLLIVWRRVDLPVVVEDWRTEMDQERRMGELLETDRRRGLDLGAVPPMRLRIIRTRDEVYEVIWTCHHLHVDGWSSAIVLEDVMALYRSAGESDRPLPAPPTDGLRSYVVWASGRGEDDLRQYWSRVLSGYTGASPVQLGSLAGSSGSGELTVEIADGMAERVSLVASELGVPPATLVQAAWAVVLGILTGEDDVAFGTTVSGRNADVLGMERLVGYFSNAVPIRVAIDRSAAIPTWLADFRNRQFELAQYEHASLADIHRWSDVPGHRAMFETFVVIENFPAGDTAADGVAQSGFRSGLTTAYPITLAVGMATPWFFELQYDRGRCSEEGARALIDQLRRVLVALVDHPQGTVADLVDGAEDVLSALVSRPGAAANERPQGGKASRTETERRLAEIWCRHLDLTDVGIDVDYFDLGGTSLGAVRLFGSIREAFGINLPLSTLLAHPTIEDLAAVISGVESGGAVEFTSLTPIQPNGSKPPIAAVHGNGGEVFIYRQLAEQLGPDQPFYGLQPVGLDGVTRPLDTVPAMASRYIEELRQVQPKGPYRLVGFCFGGTVCLEMAAQLEDGGHEVEFIGVIDGGLPVEAARYDSARERLNYLVRSRGPGGAARAAIRHVGWRVGEWWKAAVGRARGEQRTNQIPVAMACDRAFNAFEPRPSSAPITLIRSAEERDGEGKDWDFAWGDYTPRLIVEDVEADHNTLFEGAAVEALADIIRRSIGE
jgi:thioesterase domain-containing protein/acyl carrier protein